MVAYAEELGDEGEFIAIQNTTKLVAHGLEVEEVGMEEKRFQEELEVRGAASQISKGTGQSPGAIGIKYLQQRMHFAAALRHRPLSSFMDPAD